MGLLDLLRPTVSPTQRRHAHTCESCGHTWWHDPDACIGAGATAETCAIAHVCENCGAEQYVVDLDRCGSEQQGTPVNTSLRERFGALETAWRPVLAWFATADQSCPCSGIAAPLVADWLEYADTWRTGNPVQGDIATDLDHQREALQKVLATIEHYTGDDGARAGSQPGPAITVHSVDAAHRYLAAVLGPEATGWTDGWRVLQQGLQGYAPWSDGPAGPSADYRIDVQPARGGPIRFYWFRLEAADPPLGDVAELANAAKQALGGSESWLSNALGGVTGDLNTVAQQVGESAGRAAGAAAAQAASDATKTQLPALAQQAARELGQAAVPIVQPIAQAAGTTAGAAAGQAATENLPSAGVVVASVVGVAAVLGITVALVSKAFRR